MNKLIISTRHNTIITKILLSNHARVFMKEPDFLKERYDSMKLRLSRFLLIFLLIILLSRIIYPYTRFAHQESLSHVGMIRLNKEYLELYTGETFSLHLVGTINRRCSYKSTDFKVASVNSSGKITAHRSGIAIIQVTQKKTIYTCKVKVLNAEE